MADLIQSLGQKFVEEIHQEGWWWFFFGLIAQLSFTGRFLVQWIVSEKKGRSVVPVHFWYLSLLGGAMLLVYFVGRGESIGALGQTTGVVVYIRNIMLIHKEKRRPAAQAG
jgi:lipid-A-disaccharide synthase-like uncharacterized protein